MRVKAVDFAGAIGAPGQDAPGELPQVAFSGRSNVGKSSLINALLGRTRTQMARVSSTPGKTREINFFDVRVGLEPDDRDFHFFLVDLPGYGYARAPDALKKQWQDLLAGFLRRSTAIRGVVQLIDARHGPTADDRTMLDFLAHAGLPTLFALTKVDKLKSRERARQLALAAGALGADEEQFVPVSARTGEGREQLLASLEDLLKDGTG